MKHNVFDDYFDRKITNAGNVFGEYLVNKGLYDEFSITKENICQLADLVGGHVKIDVYCPLCKEKRVFSCEKLVYYWNNDGKIDAIPLENDIISWQKTQALRSRGADSKMDEWTWTTAIMGDAPRLMTFKFCCAMDSTHRLDYIVLTDGCRMRKIGQYPSVADLSLPELKEYKKVVSEEDERELKRAIGLHAQGIGVGSFVYLRRIFERILIKASQKAIEDKTVDEDKYKIARVEDKVKMLAEYLPQSLVNNTVFYGIVSKGIHELSEEECISYFPVMKSFIMMVLRQWEMTRKEEEEERDLNKALNQIAIATNRK